MRHIFAMLALASVCAVFAPTSEASAQTAGYYEARANLLLYGQINSTPQAFYCRPDATFGDCWLCFRNQSVQWSEPEVFSACHGAPLDNENEDRVFLEMTYTCEYSNGNYLNGNSYQRKAVWSCNWSGGGCQAEGFPQHCN